MTLIAVIETRYFLGDFVMNETTSCTALLKPRYEKWDITKGGSVNDWLEILDDQIDFRSLAMGRDARISFTKPRHSKEELKGYFEGLLNEWTMIHYTVEHYIEQDNKVCVIGSTSWTNKSTGKTVETPKSDFWEFKNGKAISFFEFYDTAAMFDCATS